MTQNDSDQKHLCWNCKTDIGFKHFCDACVKVQPTQGHVDFFAFFELPRHLSVDLKALEQKFYELSKKFHPDFYQQATPKERELALEKSSVLNQAYETLRDPFLRAEYILDLENFACHAFDEKSSSELLAEMFEIQERVESIRSARKNNVKPESARDAEQNLNELRQSVKEKAENVRAQLQQIFQQWDEVQDKARHASLAYEMNKLIHEKKYLDTALRTIEEASQ